MSEGALQWRELRALPKNRRRAIARAIREGRAVDDPRDAELAVRWAQRIQKSFWPRWMLPRSRPHGWRVALWIAHFAWIVIALAVVIVAIWPSLGFLRWILLACLLDFVLVMPFLAAMMLRMRWNAPEAERLNRALLDRTGG